ncbi:hypothetical protein BA011_25480 (plasmid) [Rhizobium leguminosarum]|uniref:Uncharacterized protein n=1 Tax=Rhizobium leguminosarum TaxID=384 RepID=A0A1B1CHA7_RHILE|nr:hypothetical protein BA011_25480 [Rhizobium leguminosarum]
MLRHSADLDHRDKLGAGRKASGPAAKFLTTKSTKARTFGGQTSESAPNGIVKEVRTGTRVPARMCDSAT